MTATLNLAYKKPTFADQYVVLRSHLVNSKGRKAWVKGTIEDLEGNVLVEAEYVKLSLFSLFSSLTISLQRIIRPAEDGSLPRQVISARSDGIE